MLASSNSELTFCAGSAGFLPLHQLAEQSRYVRVQLVNSADQRTQIIFNINADFLSQSISELQLCKHSYRRHLWFHFLLSSSRTVRCLKTPPKIETSHELADLEIVT